MYSLIKVLANETWTIDQTYPDVNVILLVS